ncbi:uncharacterized protein [Argopecten irradians]|uniref:uncharacterized protein n=1 Tax=Argopecten irradians TaxID=31199 RepID=UPI00371D54A3
MPEVTGETARSVGYNLGPDIPWKPYQNKNQDYKPHTYSTTQSYDRVHEYQKVHEYKHAHEHKYSEYKSSYKPTYREYKLNIKKKEPLLLKPSQPNKVPRKAGKKNYGVLHLCYEQPIGPDIRVKEHKYREYEGRAYEPRYVEYTSSTEPYINRKWTDYRGNIGYVLTPHNHYPFKWGNHDHQNKLDVNDNNIKKESTQTSLSKVNPVVFIKEPIQDKEPDPVEEDETSEVETGLYRDPTLENTPFVEQDNDEDFNAAPLVVTDQVVTPLPTNDPPDDVQNDEDEPDWDEVKSPVPIVAAAAVGSTGGHVAPTRKAENVPEEQPQDARTESTDPVPEVVDNEQSVAPIVVAAAAASQPNNDPVPSTEHVSEEPVEESGRWSSRTTHGAEGNADRSLTPVEAVAAAAVVGGAVASQSDPAPAAPSNAETSDPARTSEAPTSENVAPVAETAAAPVAAVPVVAAAAVVAESSAPTDATVAASTGGRLPPEVVANIEAYNAAHIMEVYIVETITAWKPGRVLIL